MADPPQGTLKTDNYVFNRESSFVRNAKRTSPRCLRNFPSQNRASCKRVVPNGKNSEFFQRARGGPPSALRHARAEGDRSGGNSPPWRSPSSNMTPPHPMRNMGASPVLIGSLEASGGRRKIKSITPCREGPPSSLHYWYIIRQEYRQERGPRRGSKFFHITILCSL